MALISQNIFEAAGLDADFAIDGDELTQKWVVISDDVNEGPQAVYAAGVFPKKGDLWAYGSDVGGVVRCSSVKVTREALVVIPEQEPLGAKWVVTCRFDTPEEEDTENPLNQATRYSWQSVMKEEVFERDVDTDEHVCNSAGQSFDPPVMRDNLNWVMVASRNEATFSASYAQSYANHVNSTTFAGGAAGTWKCNDVRAEPQFHESVGDYYAISVSFAFDPRGWNRDILDAGRYQYSDAPDTVYDPIVDSTGSPVADPVPLDGDGFALSQASISGGTRFWREFKKYEEADFNVLFP